MNHGFVTIRPHQPIAGIDTIDREIELGTDWECECGTHGFTPSDENLFDAWTEHMPEPDRERARSGSVTLSHST